MGPRSRIRGSRRSFSSLQGSIHLLTGFVTLCIFLSEAAVKDRSAAKYVSPNKIIAITNSELQQRAGLEFVSAERLHMNTHANTASKHHELEEKSVKIKGVSLNSIQVNSSSPSSDLQLLKSTIPVSNPPIVPSQQESFNRTRRIPVDTLVKNTNKTILWNKKKQVRNISFASSDAVKRNGQHSPKEDDVFLGVQMNKENGELFKYDNITTLSYMLYRLIKTHKITSIIDVPCSRSMKWMPQLLMRLEFEVPRFQYRCIVPDDNSLLEAIVRYEDLESATVVKDGTVWASKLPRTDLAFLWYSLGYSSSKESWHLIKALFKASTKFILVPNFPTLQANPGTPSKDGEINVRRAPYRFNEPLRVINNMSSSPSVSKQLLMYSLEGFKSSG